MRPQVAIACFLVLFGAVELMDWFQKRDLPMPVLVMGGVLLAVGSNYNKLPLDRLRSVISKDIFDKSSLPPDPE